MEWNGILISLYQSQISNYQWSIGLFREHKVFLEWLPVLVVVLVDILAHGPAGYDHVQRRFEHERLKTKGSGLKL